MLSWSSSLPNTRSDIYRCHCFGKIQIAVGIIRHIPRHIIQIRSAYENLSWISGENLIQRTRILFLVPNLDFFIAYSNELSLFSRVPAICHYFYFLLNIYSLMIPRRKRGTLTFQKSNIPQILFYLCSGFMMKALLMKGLIFLALSFGGARAQLSSFPRGFDRACLAKPCDDATFFKVRQVNRVNY